VGSVGPDFPIAATVDIGGHLHVAGFIAEPTDFGGGLLTPRAGNRGFVLQLDGLGDFVSAFLVGEDTVAMGVEPGGQLMLGGGKRWMRWGPVFLEKRSAEGTTLWALSHDEYMGTVRGIAPGPGGRVAVAGLFFGSVHFGSAVLESAGGVDGFVAVFGP
jgi:hypothetical protein